MQGEVASWAPTGAWQPLPVLQPMPPATPVAEHISDSDDSAQALLSRGTVSAGGGSRPARPPGIRD